MMEERGAAGTRNNGLAMFPHGSQTDVWTGSLDYAALGSCGSSSWAWSTPRKPLGLKILRLPQPHPAPRPERCHQQPPGAARLPECRWPAVDRMLDLDGGCPASDDAREIHRLFVFGLHGRRGTVLPFRLDPHVRQLQPVDQMAAEVVAQDALQGLHIGLIEHHPQSASRVQPASDRRRADWILVDLAIGNHQLVDSLQAEIIRNARLSVEVSHIAVVELAQTARDNQIIRRVRLSWAQVRRGHVPCDRPIDACRHDRRVQLATSSLTLQNSLRIRYVEHDRLNVEPRLTACGQLWQQQRQPGRQLRACGDPDPPPVLQCRRCFEIRSAQNLPWFVERIRHHQVEDAPFLGNAQMQAPHIRIHCRMFDAECGWRILCCGIATGQAVAQNQRRHNNQPRSDARQDATMFVQR